MNTLVRWISWTVRLSLNLCSVRLPSEKGIPGEESQQANHPQKRERNQLNP
jgi:hypothetical protein